MTQALLAPPLLGEFNAAGVLDLADVHVARTLGRLCGEERPEVLLAAALVVRAPRLGHTCVDLETVRATVTPADESPVDVDDLLWPDPAGWLETVASSPMVGQDRPLRVDGGLLYSDRHWHAEQRVERSLLARAAAAAPAVDEQALADGLAGMEDAQQRRAAEVAVRRTLAVVAGGPGTGKTWTIKRILELLAAQAAARGEDAPRIALVAPTGKAAQRVTESVGDEDFKASTIHKLLGTRPDSSTRFRHDAGNPLPHDVVVVDETSMVSLDLMAKLLDAVRPDARLLLVGDPDQLSSVESGAVLGDIVGPARESPSAAGPLHESIVVLQGARRYDARSGIADLATAIQDGDADAVVGALTAGSDDVRWLPVDAAVDGVRTGATVAAVREAVVSVNRGLVEAAGEGRAADALDALDAFRVLCAHRHGRYGVSAWVEHAERWLAEAFRGFDATSPWYVGRPVLVTQNDYQLNVRNGDTGVTVLRDDRVTVAFRSTDGVRFIAPHRLDAVATVHAMTIHKGQGSQLDSVVVVLPDASSRILTRELLYTAVTRAQSSVTVVGPEETIRAAVDRRAQRASGLRARLWPAPTTV